MQLPVEYRIQRPDAHRTLASTFTALFAQEVSKDTPVPGVNCTTGVLVTCRLGGRLIHTFPWYVEKTR